MALAALRRSAYGLSTCGLHGLAALWLQWFGAPGLRAARFSFFLNFPELVSEKLTQKVYYLFDYGLWPCGAALTALISMGFMGLRPYDFNTGLQAYGLQDSVFS